MRQFLSIRIPTLIAASFVFGLAGCSVSEFQSKSNSAAEADALGATIRGIPAEQIQSEQSLNMRDLPVIAGNLVIELPKGLLNENYVFGGVITEVTAFDNEELGGLKASDYPSTLAKQSFDGTSNQLSILGCKKVCKETSQFMNLMNVKATESLTNPNHLLVDFSSLANELEIPYVDDLAKKQKSVVSFVEYSMQTLIFEITSDYVATEKEAITNFQMKTRWYLKLTSFFDPTFVSRAPIKEVGFFQNIYSEEVDFSPADQRINRFSLQKPIHFYLKNIPTEYRKAFADSIDDWNLKLFSSFKRKLIEYEFLEKTDPRHSQIITGDIRYNVIEWDEKNAAGYGGLGPSYAHPITGQTFSAITLVQGPMILKIYKEWFRLGQEVQRNRSSKKLAQEFRDFLRSVKSNPILNQPSRGRSEGDFVVHSKRPELQDPLFDKNDFDLPPGNLTFEQYMYGYFRDLVAHELGHNLGLRHNFRGNLGSDDSMTQGSVSRSIMEDLSRLYRHLDEVGPYDVMAMNYGYLGIPPEHDNWYCTDDDQFSAERPNQNQSAECSSSDAGSDQVSFFEKRIERVYELIVNPKEKVASVWAVSDVEAVMKTAVNGLSAYIVTAPFVATDGWTNFFEKFDRPTEKFEVSQYLLKRLQDRICPATLQADLSNKTLAADTENTKAKLRELYKSVQTVMEEYKKPYPFFQEAQWSCLRL
ncbi:MAG: zinc-dependent metalloprotease [Pseudobdellovibrionaceae bacterium]